jgi:hypothetical protein
MAVDFSVDASDSVWVADGGAMIAENEHTRCSIGKTERIQGRRLKKGNRYVSSVDARPM